MHRLLLATFFLTFLVSPLTCQAGDSTAATSAPVSADQSSCREIAALAQKYGTDRKLPDSVVTGGQPCPKGEAAACLLAVIEKVQEKCAKEGKEAVPQEDIDRISVLHETLKAELAQHEGYRTRREEIEKLLARPEPSEFIYKVGANGFLRGEGAGNLHLADQRYAPGQTEGHFVYRVKPYVYWHPTAWLDIHAEGEGYGFTGASPEHNQVSLYQGFVEARLPGSDLFALKGGRQEISYGSTYILGTNSFYDGLSYDALRLRVHPVASLTVDLFWGAYASPFDTGLNGDLAGLYATYTFAEGTAVEAYVLRDAGAPERHGREHLDIYGLRGTARLGPISLEFEPVYESGRHFTGTTGANDGINAFGGHLDLTYDAILAGYKNRFLAGYAYGSGSQGAANGANFSREFRNPNNDSSIFGDIGIMVDQSGSTVNGHHASGLQTATLGWGIDPTKALNFSVTGHYYYADYAQLGFSRTIGLETDFTATYALNEGVSFILGYDRFFTGGFFRDASGSGRDVDYGYLMVQFDISKSKPKLKLDRG